MLLYYYAIFKHPRTQINESMQVNAHLYVYILPGNDSAMSHTSLHSNDLN